MAGARLGAPAVAFCPRWPGSGLCSSVGLEGKVGACLRQGGRARQSPSVGDLKSHHRKATYFGFHVFAFIGVSPPLEAEAKGLHILQHLLKRDLCIT